MMLAKDFADLHGVSLNSIHVARNTKTIPEASTWTANHKLYIDDEFFTKRRKFRRKVTLYNHDMYYLVRETANETEIAKAIGVSIQYINSSMWALDDSSILKHKVNTAAWKTYRYFKAYERMLKKRFGVKFNISKVLDETAMVA